MEIIKYDSKSEVFKKPFGAVSNTQKVSFFIHILNNENIIGVDFIYRQDNLTAPIYISMQYLENYDNYLVFGCDVTFETPDLYFYRFELKTESGIKYIGLKDGETAIGEWLSEWQLTVYDENFKTPDWVWGGIMYQIFPDRFCKSDDFKPQNAKNERTIHENWYDIPEFIYNNPSYKANDYYGGNILGIKERLSYIKSLGVNVIYLNPIFESPEYHRYSTANYFNVDPYFGTNEQFKALCEECEKTGIKVILDGVFSHTGADSIYFNKYSNYNTVGAYNSENSEFYDWYNFVEYPDRYECWWDFENLPNVNENNPKYKEYITGENGVINYWQNMGCGGYRLDVADELPDEFIDSLYKRAKENDKNSFIIGEVWEDATNKFSYGKRRRYLLGGQMDSVMNYPWRTAILDFVCDKNASLFHDRLICILENYPPQVLKCLMNSISTHDTVRAITHLGVSKDIPDEEKGAYKMTDEEYETGKRRLLNATFLQFTLPGIPSIYYGDEVGLQGFRDPYCRMTYPYGFEDNSILEFYREIAKIRTDRKEDFSSDMKISDYSDGFFCFERGNLIIAINLGSETKCIETKGKKVIFSHGENTVCNQTLNMDENSLIILE